eukprot:gnl/TRDRNA2_/TRDRNA2_81314_c0_seq1.p1 gnl/TRDRNA2_/TRDRNA2_81314_c0~~gnl/TRDRNA2_/TRDRNA2_81314_c0_seq1.p1  ORF type:complete len:360 (+),score=31.14 gnl/TRDRNA2_/TRDRNA2_81314_c0_seq1:62-1141(+)
MRATCSVKRNQIILAGYISLVATVQLHSKSCDHADDTSVLARSDTRDVPESALHSTRQKLLDAEALLLRNVSQLRRRFQNTHFEFIGDSITRYQYINLVHVLLHGTVPSDAIGIFPRGHGETGDTYEWNSYYADSNKALRSPLGSEACDCYRVPGGCRLEADDDKKLCMENRFTSLPSLNASINFNFWAGPRIPLIGHWLDRDQIQSAYCEPGKCSAEPAYRFGNEHVDGVIRFLKEVVMRRQPTPTHVFMNRWAWGDLDDKEMTQIFAAGKSLMKRYPGTKFVWFAPTHNTKPKPDREVANAKMDEAINNTKLPFGWGFFNLWTATANLKAEMVDDLHYSILANSYFNSLLLEQFLPA